MGTMNVEGLRMQLIDVGVRNQFLTASIEIGTFHIL